MSLPNPVPQDDPLDVLPELAAFARPRLRDDVPIMWRGPSAIQIGDDVTIDRVTRSHVAWMTSLDGLHGPSVIVDSLTLPEHEARRLLRALVAATALEDAATMPPSLRWLRQPERDMAAGRYAAALRTYRDPEHAFGVVAAREACRVSIRGDGPVAAAVSEAVTAAGLTHDDAHGTVVVLADAPHPDVPMVPGLPVDSDSAEPDLPHLHVGVLGARAVVGPLVVPRRTACLRCAHLHRRDADPAWPLLAVQWSQAVAGMTVRPLDPLLVRLAADHAALLLRAWADTPEEPDTWSDFALDITLPGGQATRVARPAHPLCGCRWPAG